METETLAGHPVAVWARSALGDIVGTAGEAVGGRSTDHTFIIADQGVAVARQARRSVGRRAGLAGVGTGLTGEVGLQGEPRKAGRAFTWLLIGAFAAATVADGR